MIRIIPHGAAVLSIVMAAACGGPFAPTVPSAGARPTSTPGTQASAAPVATTWSCFAARAPQSLGIFGSASVETSCASRARVVETAAITAPGAPTNLTSSVNGGTVTLTWGAPTSVDPASSYVIEAGATAGSTNIAVFDTLSSATSFTVSGVPAGTYFVRVRARNSAGTSSTSNEVVVIVGGACTSAPGAPTGLGSSVSGSTVTLTWTAPAGGCAPTGYIVEAGSSSGASNLANFNTGSTATTFSAGGVPNGTYFVRARAANSNGTSGVSNEITVVVGGPAVATLTGRWIGLVANGDGTNLNSRDCGLEKADWQLDLTQTGSTVTGTLNQNTVLSGCDPPGTHRTGSISGTVGSGTFSFTLDGNGSRTGTGTFTASRMSGTTTFAGTFALNKQ
jgi:hypothetical protein